MFTAATKPGSPAAPGEAIGVAAMALTATDLATDTQVFGVVRALRVIGLGIPSIGQCPYARVVLRFQ